MSNIVMLLSIALFLIIIATIYSEYENKKMKNIINQKKNTSIVEATIQKMFDILGANINTNQKIDR